MQRHLLVWNWEALQSASKKTAYDSHLFKEWVKCFIFHWAKEAKLWLHLEIFAVDVHVTSVFNSDPINAV
jgi:hypothetical protein